MASASNSGCRKNLQLGNLDAKRNWGYAGDYVEAMWLMLQQESPDDYVVATGGTHRRERISASWRSDTLAWITRSTSAIDPPYFRPTEVDLLLGDSSKARKTLGWKPKTDFATLVKLMMDSDLGTDEEASTISVKRDERALLAVTSSIVRTHRR